VNVFQIGNTVRHKECYWGEPAYYIHNVTTSGAHGIPTGSKHGKAWDKTTSCLIYEESEPKYKICPLYMRAWLWLIGNIVELRK